MEKISFGGTLLFTSTLKKWILTLTLTLGEWAGSPSNFDTSQSTATYVIIIKFERIAKFMDVIENVLWKSRGFSLTGTVIPRTLL